MTMTLATLPNLYCLPADVYDSAGIDATQLRVDDRNNATGQLIAATATAIVGATSIVIAALQYPLLLGTHLVFDKGALEYPVEVDLTAMAASGATTLTVAALTVAIPAGGQAIDNGTNVWLAGLLLKACRYATAQVKSYCSPRYADADLATSWSVNRWATALAVHWIAQRNFRTNSAGPEADYKDAIAEMKSVRAGQMNVDDIPTRTTGGPFFSNITLDDRFTYRKARVEPIISDGTQTQYVQSVDWNSYLGFEF